MGSIISAIYDDIEDYENLCRFYFVKPVCDKYGPDPYCKHAQQLKEQYKEDIRKIVENQINHDATTSVHLY